MKKLFAVLLIVCLSVTSVFATVTVKTDDKGTGVEGEASTKISLTIDEATLNSYRIGFSSDADANLETDDPTGLSNIVLSYTRDTDIEVENAGYVYYLFKATTKPYLKLTAGPGLTNSQVNGTIAYTITTTDGDIGNGQSVTLTTNDLSTGKSTGFISFGIKIAKSEITPDMGKGTWEDQITLTVSANA